METKKKLKVLAVSGNGETMKTLERCFKKWGYEYGIMPEAGEPRDIIIKISPDVIIADVPLNDKKNSELCDSLKADFVTAHIPFIVLADKRHLRKYIEDIKTAPDDYAVKPIDPFLLKLRLETAVKRARHSFYASPLTGLPGGILAEDFIRKKIDKKAPFAVGHIDIDNFKAFNDKYGYSRGDRVIMQTAYMLTSSMRKKGNRNDFAGHIGGDDFVIITTPDRYKDIARDFICEFDTIIPFHYESEDRRAGSVKVMDRTKKIRNVPLMSVTAAFVLKSGEEQAVLAEINQSLAEVKKYLKSIKGSKYMADRRTQGGNDKLSVEIFKNHHSLAAEYKPVGQILIERGILTNEQLDSALKFHWRRGLPLGEVLKDMGLTPVHEIEKALMLQGRKLS